MRLVVLGAPATKKNSQRIVTRKRDGRNFIMQSSQSCDWQKTAAEQICAQRRGLCFGYPVAMVAVVYRKRASGDLLNYLAAVSDALEKGGAVTNDRLIVRLDGCRMDKDAINPRVEIELIPI